MAFVEPSDGQGVSKGDDRVIKMDTVALDILGLLRWVPTVREHARTLPTASWPPLISPSSTLPACPASLE